MDFKINLYQDDKLSKYCALAFGLHLVVVLLAFVFSYLFSANKIGKAVNEQVKMVQTSVRVDVVAMPRFTVKELQNMRVSSPKEIAPKEAETQKASESFQTAKVDLKNLLSKISKQKITAFKKKTSKRKSKGDLAISTKKLKQLILEGNKVSQGTLTVGSRSEQEQSLFSKYVSTLPNYIRPYWKLPSYLMDQDIKCRIRIFVAANGKVLRSEIYESSGVAEFDQRALSALRKVGHLPTPQSEILARVSSGEVILGFPL